MARNLTGVSTKRLDYKILSISILKHTGGSHEHEYIVAELASSRGDISRLILFWQQQHAENKPLPRKPKPTCLSVRRVLNTCVRPTSTRAWGHFTKLFANKHSVGQALERVADKHPTTGLCLSSNKNVKVQFQWRLTNNISPPFALSTYYSALYRMSQTRIIPSGDVNHIVFPDYPVTRDEWTQGIIDVLNSNTGLAQELNLLIQRFRVTKAYIFKKYSAPTQHEYIVTIIKTQEGRTYRLRFDRRDRGTGVDDPSPADRPANTIFSLPRRLIPAIFNVSARSASVCGTDAIDRVWSNPEHQLDDIAVRVVHFKQEDRPSLLDLIVACKTISNQHPQYSLLHCHHCYWLADSLSALLERISPHQVLTAASLQGRCRGVRIYVRNRVEVGRMLENVEERKNAVSHLNLLLCAIYAYH